MEQRIEELDAAKNYLSHLLYCEDDDMAGCAYLDGELSAHTTRTYCQQGPGKCRARCGWHRVGPVRGM